MTHPPSPQQSAIHNWFMSSVGNAIIYASAGSGKTTLITQLTKLCPIGGHYVALALNKEIALTFESRLPYYVQSSTFHKACKDAITSCMVPAPKINEDKCANILKNLVPDWKRRSFIQRPLLRLVALLKQFDDTVTPAEIATEYNIDLDPEWFHLALKVQRTSDDDLTCMDFEDMLRFALRPEVKFRPANVILLDEGQDTNQLQRRLLLKMLAVGGRVVIVGDQNQAIYAFRGAGHTSMDDLRKDFNCTQFPLSVSYRCSIAVVEEARRILQLPWGGPAVGTIDPAPDAVPGSVTRSSELPLTPTTILCRTNAPLLAVALQALRNGHAVRIVGRDLKDQFENTIKRSKAASLSDLRKYLAESTGRQLRKARGASARRAVEDMAACYNLLLSRAVSMGDLSDLIAKLFATTNPFYTFSTAHRAKGLEWDSVHILNRNLFNSFADTDAESQQERNLLYVAVTRARVDLCYLTMRLGDDD